MTKAVAMQMAELNRLADEHEVLAGVATTRADKRHHTAKAKMYREQAQTCQVFCALADEFKAEENKTKAKTL